MVKKIDGLVSVVSKFVSPAISKVLPFYKKKILPKQKIWSSAFMQKLSPFLKLSISDRKKVLEQNFVAKFRTAAIGICLFQALFSAVISYSSAVVFGAVFLSYLIFRGYRVSYILAAFFVAVSVFSLLGVEAVNSFLLILWLVLALVTFAFAFKYENARIGLENSFELKRSQYSLQTDVISAVIYAFALWLVAFIIILFVSLFATQNNDITENSEELNAVAGIAARHIYGYADYCKSQGYELKRYPEVFAKKFEPAVMEIQSQLTARESSLSEFYDHAKRAFGKRLFDSLAADIDEVRKQAIIEAIALKNNISASQVVWSDEYNKEISPEEGCVIFDEMADSIVSSSSADLQKLKNY